MDMKWVIKRGGLSQEEFKKKALDYLEDTFCISREYADDIFENCMEQGYTIIGPHDTMQVNSARDEILFR